MPCHVSKSNFSIAWHWTLTSWPVKLTISFPGRVDQFTSKLFHPFSKYRVHKFELSRPPVTSSFDLLTPKVDRFILPHTGWLKLKYHTRQNAIYRQRVRLLYQNFLLYMGELLLQFWIFFTNYFSFLQSYGYINILCHICNFHSRHGFCGHLFRWEGKIAFNSKQDQSEC